MWSGLALYLPGPELTQRSATGQALFVVSILRKVAETNIKPDACPYPSLRAEPGFTVQAPLSISREVISIQQRFKRNTQMVEIFTELYGLHTFLVNAVCCKLPGTGSFWKREI